MAGKLRTGPSNESRERSQKNENQKKAFPLLSFGFLCVLTFHGIASGEGGSCRLGGTVVKRSGSRAKALKGNPTPFD